MRNVSLECDFQLLLLSMMRRLSTRIKKKKNEIGWYCRVRSALDCIAFGPFSSSHSRLTAMESNANTLNAFDFEERRCYFRSTN